MDWKSEYKVPLVKLLMPESKPLFPLFFMIGFLIIYIFISKLAIFILALPLVIFCLWLYVKYEHRIKAFLNKN
ncbi:MAG: hypothetical protein CML20_14645 [Rheinheimera sp.]|nr:hypothetical protein [Rheinheimera sp.]